MALQDYISRSRNRTYSRAREDREEGQPELVDEPLKFTNVLDTAQKPGFTYLGADYADAPESLEEYRKKPLSVRQKPSDQDMARANADWTPQGREDFIASVVSREFDGVNPYMVNIEEEIKSFNPDSPEYQEFFNEVFGGQISWVDRTRLNDAEYEHWNRALKAKRGELDRTIRQRQKDQVGQLNYLTGEWDKAAAYYGKEAKAKTKTAGTSKAMGAAYKMLGYDKYDSFTGDLLDKDGMVRELAAPDLANNNRILRDAKDPKYGEMVQVDYEHEPEGFLGGVFGSPEMAPGYFVIPDITPGNFAEVDKYMKRIDEEVDPAAVQKVREAVVARMRRFTREEWSAARPGKKREEQPRGEITSEADEIVAPGEDEVLDVKPEAKITTEGDKPVAEDRGFISTAHAATLEDEKPEEKVSLPDTVDAVLKTDTELTAKIGTEDDFNANAFSSKVSDIVEEYGHGYYDTWFELATKLNLPKLAAEAEKARAESERGEEIRGGIKAAIAAVAEKFSVEDPEKYAETQQKLAAGAKEKGGLSKKESSDKERAGSSLDDLISVAKEKGKKQDMWRNFAKIIAEAKERGSFNPRQRKALKRALRLIGIKGTTEINKIAAAHEEEAKNLRASRKKPSDNNEIV